MLVTLYGKGAIVVHDVRNTYTPKDGALTVPAALVPQLLAQGWTRDRRNLDPIEVAVTDEPAVLSPATAGLAAHVAPGSTNGGAAGSEGTPPAGGAPGGDPAEKLEEADDLTKPAASEPIQAPPAAAPLLPPDGATAEEIAQYDELVAEGLSAAEVYNLVWAHRIVDDIGAGGA